MSSDEDEDSPVLSDGDDSDFGSGGKRGKSTKASGKAGKQRATGTARVGVRGPVEVSSPRKRQTARNATKAAKATPKGKKAAATPVGSRKRKAADSESDSNSDSDSDDGDSDDSDAFSADSNVNEGDEDGDYYEDARPNNKTASAKKQSPRSVRKPTVRKQTPVSAPRPVAIDLTDDDEDAPPHAMEVDLSSDDGDLVAMRLVSAKKAPSPKKASRSGGASVGDVHIDGYGGGVASSHLFGVGSAGAAGDIESGASQGLVSSQGASQDATKGKKAKMVIQSAIPIVVPHARRHTTFIMETNEPELDLSGDTGAVGRFTVVGDEESPIVLDLKGFLFKGNLRSCASLMVVNIGAQVAKVEAVIDRYLHCNHASNVLDTETMVEGQLEEDLDEVSAAVTDVWRMDEEGDAPSQGKHKKAKKGGDFLSSEDVARKAGSKAKPKAKSKAKGKAGVPKRKKATAGGAAKKPKKVYSGTKKTKSKNGEPAKKRRRTTSE